MEKDKKKNLIEHLRKIATKHGMYKTKIYASWCYMKSRCLNPKDTGHNDYGGRGIKVCKKWLTFEGFYEDMGSCYKEGLTLERVNVNGNYEKKNCKWIPLKKQALNKRSNLIIEFNGKEQTLKEWSDELGIGYYVLLHRIGRGWSFAKTLSTPKLKKGSNQYKIAYE